MRRSDIANVMKVPILSWSKASMSTTVIANQMAGEAPLPCPVPWNGSSGVHP